MFRAVAANAHFGASVLRDMAVHMARLGLFEVGGIAAECVVAEMMENAGHFAVGQLIGDPMHERLGGAIQRQRPDDAVAVSSRSCPDPAFGFGIDVDAGHDRGEDLLRTTARPSHRVKITLVGRCHPVT
jgi:hypothetical protein